MFRSWQAIRKLFKEGKADGLYITTAGVGLVRPGLKVGGAQAKPGDVVILSGSIGDHGIAVLGARGELGFQSSIQSDVAPLNHLIDAMLDASDNVHVLRDPTRGGLGTTLNEIASQSNIGIVLNELTIPVHPEVNAACEMLGFDPLYIANEGKLIAMVAHEDADAVLKVMRQTRYGEGAVIIGEVTAEPRGRVLMKTAIGSRARGGYAGGGNAAEDLLRRLISEYVYEANTWHMGCLKSSFDAIVRIFLASDDRSRHFLAACPSTLCARQDIAALSWKRIGLHFPRAARSSAGEPHRPSPSSYRPDR